MNQNYADILSRIPEPPKWFDEHAVPRFCDFEPNEVADIYAEEVALVEIACQSCDHKFLVAFSLSRMSNLQIINGIAKFGPSLEKQITQKSIWYGDPPNIQCCPAGPTMSSDTIRVVEFWNRNHQEFVKDNIVTDVINFIKWVRRPELEIAFEPIEI